MGQIFIEFYRRCSSAVLLSKALSINVCTYYNYSIDNRLTVNLTANNKTERKVVYKKTSKRFGTRVEFF